MDRLSTGKVMRAKQDAASSWKTPLGKVLTHGKSSCGVERNPRLSENGCMTRRRWRPRSLGGNYICATPTKGLLAAGYDTWTKTRGFFFKIFGRKSVE